MTAACDCHDPRVWGHVWPCAQSERAPLPDRVAALVAAIKRIQEATR